MEYIDLSDDGIEVLAVYSDETGKLELTDAGIKEQIYGESGDVYEEAIKEGEQKFKQETEDYYAALNPQRHENTKAVAAFRRLMR